MCPPGLAAALNNPHINAGVLNRLWFLHTFLRNTQDWSWVCAVTHMQAGTGSVEDLYGDRWIWWYGRYVLCPMAEWR